MLSFAAVGFRGREWWAPAFALAGFGVARRLASSALLFLLAAAPAWSQPSYVQGFAERIVSALAPGATVRLVCTGDDGRTQRDLAKLLSDRGLRLSDTTDGTVAVRCSCLENETEHVCLADIGDGAARHVVTVTRPRDPAEQAPQAPIVALELRPLHAQREPMLDVAVGVDASLLVLTPTAVMLLPAPSKEGAAAPARPSQPITTARVWPRDLRGRLRTNGDRFGVFLPGVTCRGSSAPFTLSCVDEGEAWPIGIDNSGIVANRNTFATPEGLSFYDAAALGDQRWLVIDQQGVVTFLDSRRRVVAKGDAADHAVALQAPCAADRYVATTTQALDRERGDVILLSRVDGDRLASVPSPIVLPGTLTALWPSPDHRVATAIVRNFHAGRYEAFHLSLSCTR